MEQFLHSMDLQDISLAVTIIAGIIGIFQFKETKNDIHVFILHQPSYTMYYNNNKPSTTGCIARCMIYIICISGIAYFSYLYYLSSLPSPISQAQTVVQSFYNNINNKDYQSAYKLTQNGFSQDYQTFASGFINTEHDDLSFTSVKQMSDGTIQVIVTVTAKEKFLEKEHTKIYTYTYTIGQEQGNYKMLTGILIEIKEKN